MPPKEPSKSRVNRFGTLPAKMAADRKAAREKAKATTTKKPSILGGMIRWEDPKFLKEVGAKKSEIMDY